MITNQRTAISVSWSIDRLRRNALSQSKKLAKHKHNADIAKEDGKPGTAQVHMLRAKKAEERIRFLKQVAPMIRSYEKLVAIKKDKSIHKKQVKQAKDNIARLKAQFTETKKYHDVNNAKIKRLLKQAEKSEQELNSHKAKQRNNEDDDWRNRQDNEEDWQGNEDVGEDEYDYGETEEEASTSRTAGAVRRVKPGLTESELAILDEARRILQRNRRHMAVDKDLQELEM